MRGAREDRAPRAQPALAVAVVLKKSFGGKNGLAEVRSFVSRSGAELFSYGMDAKIQVPVFRFPNYVREMQEFLRAIARRHGIAVHEMEIEPDHIHLFVGLPPTLCISKAFQLLKGGSSYLMRKKHKTMQKYKALWSRGKFYRSIGSATAEAIHYYIRDIHHTSRIPQSQARLA